MKWELHANGQWWDLCDEDGTIWLCENVASGELFDPKTGLKFEVQL